MEPAGRPRAPNVDAAFSLGTSRPTSAPSPRWGRGQGRGWGKRGSPARAASPPRSAAAAPHTPAAASSAEPRRRRRCRRGAGPAGPPCCLFTAGRWPPALAPAPPSPSRSRLFSLQKQKTKKENYRAPVPAAAATQTPPDASYFRERGASSRRAGVVGGTRISRARARAPGRRKRPGEVGVAEPRFPRRCLLPRRRL